MTENNPLRRLEQFGQSIWLDYIRRQMITSGELKRLIDEDGLKGMTSNPAIFEKAIAKSQDYDEAIGKLVGQNKSVLDIYHDLTVEDVQMAADIFRPLYDKLDGKDGYVSLEVNPHLARNTEGTIAEARQLWQDVNRPNVMIQVPGTPEGLPAITTLIGEGINVNVTLLFGLPRYEKVAEAYIAGLEEDVDHAAKVLQSLPELHIDINQVTQQLEDEGIEKFNKPYDSLIKTLEEKSGKVKKGA